MVDYHPNRFAALRQAEPSPMDLLRAMDEADASRGDPLPVFSERIN